MKKTLSLFLLSQLLLGSAWAQDAFVVRRIQFEGLQHISPATVESFLPISCGQTLQPTRTAAILRELYKTGYFDRITLSKRDGTLIIHVVERPTIGQLKISGNSVIATDKLTPVLRSLDIAEGRIYNASVLEKISQSLLNQYYQAGRYNARVDITASAMPRNQVCVRINISEGLTAKIRRISIIGNHCFDEKTLVKQLDITTTGLLSFMTQSDKYSEDKLDASLDKLRSFYLDHGYLHFNIKSSQAEITPDRKAVYIVVVVEEGPQYTIKNIGLTGNLIVSRQELECLITIKPGQVFSRQKVLDIEKAITNRLGDQGYLFAQVTLVPTIDEKTKQVSITFDVKPGRRAYVRHITFSENNRTNDVVLRREMLQMEAAPVSTGKLEESKHRLVMLPFLKDVEMSINPVPDVNDQVDVNYKVKEDNSAQASFKVGYAKASGVILGAGLNQKNFFGTGNTLGINFNRSKIEQFYSIDYTNPYYTPEGISRSFSFSVSRVDPGKTQDVVNGYTSNEYDFGVLYGIPIGNERNVVNNIQTGVSYQNIAVNLSSKEMVSNQIRAFVHEHGRHFQEIDFKLGFTRDSRDKAIFPTCGSINTLFFDVFAPASRQSLGFYTANYQGKWYQPLNDKFIFLARTDLGYGNGFRGHRDFPFFKNFFAGGINTVHGYSDFTLGPKDSRGNAYGGNVLVDASMGIIFPNYISDSLRTFAFVDGGNVYSTVNNVKFGGKSTNSGPLRYSVGIEADIFTPFGPIAVSLSKPIGKRPGDMPRSFQFALGANF